MVVVTIVKSNEQFTKLLSRRALSTVDSDSIWLFVIWLVEDVGNVVRLLLEVHEVEIKFELLLALFLFLSSVVVVVADVGVAATAAFKLFWCACCGCASCCC